MKSSIVNVVNAWGPALSLEHSMMKSSMLFELDPSPPTSTSHLPNVIHMISVPRLSPFFAALPLPCIILNANKGQKNGGGLGTRLCCIHTVQMLCLPRLHKCKSNSQPDVALLPFAPLLAHWPLHFRIAGTGSAHHCLLRLTP